MKSANQRPIAFILASTNHGSMLVNRFDYKTIEHHVHGVGHQLLSTSSFDPSEIDTALQLLESRKRNFGPGVVAIDCGANIGVHTIEWAQYMHGWGEVTAFEAQERIFYALAGNITLNNCFNARAIWAAIGETTGQIRVPLLNHCIPSTFGSLELKRIDHPENIGQPIDYSDAKTQPTAMVALDDLNLSRLDFIKIDIEGMEMDALRGAKASIQKLRPQLLIEKIKSNDKDIKDFMVSLGYQTFETGISILAIHASDPALLQFRK